MAQRRDFLALLTTSVLSAPIFQMMANSSFAASQAKGKRKIKAAQIGTKHAHASGKMSTMRTFSEMYDVVGVVESDDDRRQTVQDTGPYKGVPLMTEEQLLNTPGLELVCVETEVRDLLSTAGRCIDAGVHIHLDKPAGEAFPEFRRVVESARKNKQIIQMGYMFRYNPGFRVIYKAVEEGWLGQVFEAHGVISKMVGAGTRKQLAQYRGGTMFELGCHVIDSLLHFMKPLKQVTAFPRQTRPDQDDLFDNMLAVFEFPRATATVRSAVIEVNGVRRRQMVVCGDEGTVSLRPIEPATLSMTLAVDKGGYRKGTHGVTVKQLGGRYHGDFLDLYQVLREEKEFEFTYDHDLLVQKAILESAALTTK